MSSRKIDWAELLAHTRWFPALIMGPIAGSIVYLAVAFYFHKFSIVQFIMANIAFFIGIYAIRWTMDTFSSGFANSLFGFGRRVNPESLELMQLQRNIERTEGDYDFRGAVQARKDLLNSGLVPDTARLAFEIARIYEEKLSEPVDALYWYRKTLSLGGKDGGFANAAEEGIERLKQSTSTSDEDRQKREEAIRQLIEENELEQAEGHCEELRRLYPKNGAHFFFLGIMASRRENYARAASFYEQALALNPGDEKSAFNRAVALGKAEYDIEARDAWRFYLEHFGERDPQFKRTAEEAIEALTQRLESDVYLVDEN